MARRNDISLAAALQAMAQAVGQQNNAGGKMVRFDTNMLADEDDDWWVSVQPVLENGGAAVTWAVFRREFLNRTFRKMFAGRKRLSF